MESFHHSPGGGNRKNEHSYAYLIEDKGKEWWLMGTGCAGVLQWVAGKLRREASPRRQDSLTNENTEYWVHTLLAEIWPPAEVVWHHIPSYFECWRCCVCAHTLCNFCFLFFSSHNHIQIPYILTACLRMDWNGSWHGKTCGMPWNHILVTSSYICFLLL